MKTVMILSGGTSTAWHIAAVLKKFFRDVVRLIICDINYSYLVHTSIFADKYIQVPLIKSPEYYPFMLQKLAEESVDVLIPLIDDDILLFPCDNPDLRELGVVSSAPRSDTINALSNKSNLERTLAPIGIATPHIYDTTNGIDLSTSYFAKNSVGCGSKGAGLVMGEEAVRLIAQDGKVVQDVCHRPEITVDVVRDKRTVYTVCRERIETKLGVSTKCRVFFDRDIQDIMERISHQIELPNILCAQFMKASDEKWSLIDFNLRSGGGTAISAAVGFQAVRFAAAGWLEAPANKEWLCVPETERYVVRAYEEIVTK